MKKIVALFDCDGTLYSAQYGRGLINYSSQSGRKNMVRWYYTANLLPYVLRKIKLIPVETYHRTITSRLAWMLKGMNQAELRQASDWITGNYLLATERPEVVKRLREHQAQGHLVVLVSGQLFPSLEMLGEHYGADGLIGTQIEMKNGRCLGRILPPVMTGQDKDRYTREFFSTNDIDIDWQASYAYADSITDTGLFNLVGHPVAVHPDLKLLALAHKDGWEIIGKAREGQ